MNYKNLIPMLAGLFFVVIQHPASANDPDAMASQCVADGHIVTSRSDLDRAEVLGNMVTKFSESGDMSVMMKGFLLSDAAVTLTVLDEKEKAQPGGSHFEKAQKLRCGVDRLMTSRKGEEILEWITVIDQMNKQLGL